MQINNPYWQPPVEFGKVTYAQSKTNDLGFRNDLVYPLPTTIGADYFGEGRQHLELPKELTFSTQGEYFGRGGNVVPATGGKPLINIYSDIYKYKRSDNTIRV
jgi:hypothetical protein